VGTGKVFLPNNDLLLEEQAIKRAFRRLVVFLFVLCMFAQLDRSNIAFAALSMNKDLKLTATMFGFANTIFYAGYLLCEIPSNMMLAKLGPRKWISRILVTWGIASTLTMFAAGTSSLYGIRLVLGIAEAGFMPGVFLYLTYWFPASYRARATGLFLVAQPVTMAVGSQISGLILDHMNGIWGMKAWQWLFLLEGAPAALLGIVTYYYLTNRPAEAKWLDDAEKSALRRRLEREQGSAPMRADGHKVWREISSRNVILLGLTYFGLVAGINTNVTWTPQIVREVIKVHSSFSYVGLLTAIPALCTVLAMPIWSSHSDKRMERKWHLVLPLLLAAFGWLLVAFIKVPEIRMLGLIFGSTGAYGAQVIFWTIPPNQLSITARPVGLAAINVCGIAASSLSPLIIGFFRDLTHSWVVSLMFVVLVLVAAALLIFQIPTKENVAGRTASAS